ncbi:hypothetical protein PVT67_13520 [Gallaecimonas kandeliae]|uniref:hypothetical protein n=1 Tax=Gallaecimonas kandeliae TaxID=3029055 RepID=UPI00264743D7|nr:hypothetical protein [Gallaecimonas kandeliae]WKE64679.1 hypothetical protein PVT67_13520 [Gallaecimonas kandeliae]
MKPLSLAPLGLLFLAACTTAPQKPSVDTVMVNGKEVQVDHEFKEEKGVHKLKDEQQVVAVDDKGDVKKRLVCEYVKPTGSHFTQRLCHTKEEMQKEEAEAQELLRHLPNPKVVK